MSIENESYASRVKRFAAFAEALQRARPEMQCVTAEPGIGYQLDRVYLRVEFDSLEVAASTMQRGYGVPCVAASPVAQSEAIALIMRDVCETDPADPDKPDTVCINAAQLHLIIERHALGAQPGAVLETWRPMETAPRDGTMLRLLVQFEDHATEDTTEPAPTIGAYCEGAECWQFAGWCWSHDHFTEGKGEPVGWLPMLGAATSPGESA